ncbi:MAG: HAD family phosphatase [Saprospiraceae bacterium]|nr:HAD family phosphatase [Saprospiraceae bacterium]
MAVRTVIFDLGGVLIDWNPRYLYRKIFEDQEQMEYFLSHICTSNWNEEQDGGRSIKEATELLINQHPDWETEIQAFYGRWEEMLGGVFEDTVELLKRIHKSGNYRLYALTNWSAETFPRALELYDFLNWFEDVLVSGKEKIKKPDPLIYRLLLDRFQINPQTAVFTDDNLRNVLAARAEGISTIHFQSATQLEAAFNEMGMKF